MPGCRSLRGPLAPDQGGFIHHLDKTGASIRNQLCSPFLLDGEALLLEWHRARSPPHTHHINGVPHSIPLSLPFCTVLLRCMASTEDPHARTSCPVVVFPWCTSVASSQRQALSLPSLFLGPRQEVDEQVMRVGCLAGLSFSSLGSTQNQARTISLPESTGCSIALASPGDSPTGSSNPPTSTVSFAHRVCGSQVSGCHAQNTESVVPFCLAGGRQAKDALFCSMESI